MYGLSKKREEPFLRVLVNGEEVCVISENELPCEKLPSKKLDAGSVIEFIDHAGNTHKHDLGNYSGWFHFSVRVHPNKACQVDCAITESEKYDQSAFSEGKARGIRFQPFFITGAKTKNDIFIYRHAGPDQSQAQDRCRRS